MSKDKQIRELRDEIIRCGEYQDRTGNYQYPLSNWLIEKGYRKASDVAREIFAEIEKNMVIFGDTNLSAFFRGIGWKVFAELKKKFTEGEKDDG